MESPVQITETAQKVLEERYFIEGEKCWEDLADRVARFFGNSREEVEEFYNHLRVMNYLPNSPTLMNAGTPLTSYSACFVLPIEDSIESIFKFYKDAALISKSGGGVGASFSKLRANNSVVKTTDGVASGPLSFMKGQDALTNIIKQGGRRRGANMMVLDVHHPDIMDFITAKDTPGVLENANLSVMVDDEFMSKVKEGYREELNIFDEIAKRAWSSGEPGLLFKNRINQDDYTGKGIEAVNPCGEQPLLPYESCSLIAINLANIVKTSGGIDYGKLKQVTRSAVRFMNRVLDKSKFPIPECQEAMEDTRKIGVGIMGLHDMLIQIGVPYDSEEGRYHADIVMGYIANTAYTESEKIGEEEGYCKASYNASSKRRNLNLTTIAPTGTLSMIADVSSGCEPYYSPVTYKTVLDGTTFTMVNKHIPEELQREIIEDNGKTPVAALMNEEEWNLYKGAEDIYWKDHISMQAILQLNVDSGISKTINMSNDSTVEDVKNAYIYAWESDCKGITIYRDGSRDSQVLSSSIENTKEDRSKEAIVELPVPYKLVLEDELKAVRYRIKDKEGNKVYFTVCEQDDVPVEVFSRLPEEVQDSSWHTISRLLSLALRYNIPLDDITKQLRKSSSSISDTPSRVARILDKYNKKNNTAVCSKDSVCPDCGGRTIFIGGCVECEARCGWSKCG